MRCCVYTNRYTQHLRHTLKMAGSSMGIFTCETGTLIPAGRPCPLDDEDSVRAGCDQEEAEAWGS